MKSCILSFLSLPYEAVNLSFKPCWWNTDKTVIIYNRPSSIYTKTGLQSAKQTHILWLTLSQNAWTVSNIIIMNCVCFKVLDDGPKYNFTPWWTFLTILLFHQDSWTVDECSYVSTKNCITLLGDMFAGGGIDEKQFTL